MMKFCIFLTIIATPVFSQRISKFHEEPVCPKSCLEPKSAHLECGLSLTRWFYNRERKECQKFQYGGCGGNGNRFLSKNDCRKRCGECPSMDIPVDPSDDPTCSCQYQPLDPHNGGCRITVAPPKGYKCQCSFQWYTWICEGGAIKCANHETCPANCKTKECCERGISELEGDCGGYYNLPPRPRGNEIIKSRRLFPTPIEEFKRCIYGLDSDLLKLVIDQQSNLTYYNLLNHQWNARLPTVYPLAIVVPKSTEDVANTVKCGSQSKIPLIPKSGGHSYEGFSLGSNTSIVIDFRDMAYIHIDEQQGTAHIGPGAYVGQVTAALGLVNYALPVGVCFTVALGGHAIGGGYGKLSHIYGLTLDNVLEQTMVDAQGMTHIANSTNTNKDLYWALRGVGPGYIGIVTDFKVKLTPTKLADKRELWMGVGLNTYPLTEAQSLLTVWDHWLDWTEQNDRTAMSSMYITGPGFKETTVGKLQPIAAKFSVNGMHSELAVESSNVPIEFFDAFQQYWPNDTENHMLSVFRYNKMMMKTQYTPVLRDNYTHPLSVDELLNLKDYKALPRYFKCESFFVTARMTPEIATNLAMIIQRIPSQNVVVMIESQLGVIHDVPKDATAYVHRDSRYFVIAQYEGEYDAVEVNKGLEWIKDFMAAWDPLNNGEVYQNFPEKSLEMNQEYLKKYYGSNVGRLEMVKTKYDPNNYFVSPESIPVILPQRQSDEDSSQSDSSDEN